MSITNEESLIPYVAVFFLKAHLQDQAKTFVVCANGTERLY